MDNNHIKSFLQASLNFFTTPKHVQQWLDNLDEQEEAILCDVSSQKPTSTIAI